MKKEKLYIAILTVFFGTSLGMFYYQNVYLGNKTLSDQEKVMVAIDDILPGTTISTEDVAWISMDKQAISSKYVLDENEALGKVATHTIFSGEPLSKNRFEENNANRVSSYPVLLEPDYSISLKKGDLIKVYTQTQNKESSEIDSYLLFECKEVLDYQEEVVSSTKKKVSLMVKLSDSEALKYYTAMKKGEIIVLKYSDDIKNPDIIIKSVSEENSEEITENK